MDGKNPIVYLDFVELNQFCQGTCRYSSRDWARCAQVFLLIVRVLICDGRVNCPVKTIHFFVFFVCFGLVGNVIANSLLVAAPPSFHALNVNETVKGGVEGKWKSRNDQGEVGFHKFKPLNIVGWYLTIKSDLAAFLLDLRQQWTLLFAVLVEATAQAIQVLWDHGRVMELWEGVLVGETALKPMRPIMGDISCGLTFEESFVKCWKDLLWCG